MDRQAKLNALLTELRQTIADFDEEHNVPAGDIIMAVIELGLSASVRLAELSKFPDFEVVGYHSYIQAMQTQINERTKDVRIELDMEHRAEPKKGPRLFDA